MKTKVVYVLVSEETDYYYEMTRLSLQSFRLYHPKDRVEVVMDEQTHRRLTDRNDKILDDVIPIVVEIPMEYSVMQRSRFLKTQLRVIIDGDFLYLDVDTLACERLDDIDATGADLAMVSNGNVGLLSGKGFDKAVCDKAGFLQLEGEPYFNGGVMYVKDTPDAYIFFDNWHRLWKQSLYNGVPQDQPALCQTNMELGHPIREISGYWNCQISRNEAQPFARQAKIIHYFTYSDLVKSMLLKHLRDASYNDAIIDTIIKNPRDVGYLMLSMTDERLHQYVDSDLTYIFESNPPLYRTLVRMSHFLAKPIVFGSKLKHLIFRKQ